MPSVDIFSKPSPQTEPDKKRSLYDFEMGSLLFSGGSLRKSIPYLQSSMAAFLKEEDFDSYFACYDLLIQAFNEMEEKEELKTLNQEVKTSCKTHKISETIRNLGSQAYYNLYVDKDYEAAKQKLSIALKKAFTLNDKYIKSDDRLNQNIIRFEIIRCLYIYTIYYEAVKDYQSYEQELKNLKILVNDYFKVKKEIKLAHSRTNNVQELQYGHKILEFLNKNSSNIQKIQLGLKIREAQLEMKQSKNYSQAEKMLWEVYEEANKTNNLYLTPYILWTMAHCCVLLNDTNRAQMFLNLARKNCSPDRKALRAWIEELAKKGGLNQETEENSYDLIFDLKDHLIVEKQKGCIEMKNQFILMDLLRLFLSKPGIPYSKEQIIKSIWSQDYRPEFHDNKIYVTIKRLREMIELNPCKPRYICRGGEGYYFSKQAKVLVRQ